MKKSFNELRGKYLNFIYDSFDINYDAEYMIITYHYD